MLPFMLFIFLGFLCVIAVLLYFLCTQEKIAHTLRDEHAEMRLLLRALDSRLKLFEAERSGQSPRESDPIAAQADSLLKLDLVETRSPTNSTDTGLELHMDPPSDKKSSE